MTDKQIEQKFRAAMQAAAPQDVEAVLSRCKAQGRSELKMFENKKQTKIWAGVAAAAACMALVFGVGGYRAVNNNVASLVSLDVNPSIQLDLNKKERVVKAEALNEDAAAILDDMDLKGVQAEVAVNALIGSMVKNGYVSQDANSVLISVQNDDPAVAAELRQKLGDAVNQSMKADDVEGAVYSQIVAGDDQLRKKASQHGISEGRAQFIEELTRKNKNLSFDDLAERTVNDLTLLASSAKGSSEGLHTSGAVSDGKYVGREAAVNAALKRAGISAAEAVVKSVEFDMENSVMVYEVEFYAKGNEYEMDVDAVSGTVIKMQHKQVSVNTEGLMSENRAAEIALSVAGVEAKDAQGLHTEMDNENGRLIYEVEFIAGGTKYEYHLDGQTGEVLQAQKKPVDTGDGSYVGEAAAIRAALAKAGVQADSGSVICKLDTDDGRVVYEVKFVSGNTEYEVSVEASSGTVLEMDKDVHTAKAPEKAPEIDDDDDDDDFDDDDDDDDDDWDDIFDD